MYCKCIDDVAYSAAEHLADCVGAAQHEGNVVMLTAIAICLLGIFVTFLTMNPYVAILACVGAALLVIRQIVKYTKEDKRCAAEAKEILVNGIRWCKLEYARRYHIHPPEWPNTDRFLP